MSCAFCIVYGIRALLPWMSTINVHTHTCSHAFTYTQQNPYYMRFHNFQTKNHSRTQSHKDLIRRVCVVCTCDNRICLCRLRPLLNSRNLSALLVGLYNSNICAAYSFYFDSHWKRSVRRVTRKHICGVYIHPILCKWKGISVYTNANTTIEISIARKYTQQMALVEHLNLLKMDVHRMPSRKFYIHIHLKFTPILFLPLPPSLSLLRHFARNPHLK